MRLELNDGCILDTCDSLFGSYEEMTIDFAGLNRIRIRSYSQN